VAFGTLPTLEEKGMPAAEDRRFFLYANREEAYEKFYPGKKRFLIFFAGSVRGLSVRAPVLLRGIKVGRVLDVRLEFDVDALEFRIPVLVWIKP